MTKKYRIKKEYLNESGCFATGGGVPEDDERPYYLRKAHEEVAKTRPEDLPFDQAMAAMPQQIAPMPAAVGAPIEPVSAQQPMPQQPVSAPQQMQNPYMGEAMVQGEIARNQANIYDNAIKQQEQLQQDFQARTAEIDRQRQEVAQALDADPVNAQRYVQSKSGLGKASTAIGLILGGIGGGLTGQANPALDFLNKQIDRDIDAQKEGRKGKENLLAQLEKQYGNERDAVTALSGILATRTANQINQAALKSGDKLAIERAKQASATLMAPYIKSQQELALKKFANEMYAQGRNPLNEGINVPKEVQELAVPGYGLATNAELAKKLNAEIIPGQKKAEEAFKVLTGMGWGSKFNPTDKLLARDAQTVLIGALNRAFTGGGPLQQAERDMLKQSIANPSDLFTYATAERLQQLQSILGKDFEYQIKQAGLKTPQQVKPAAAQQIKSFKPAK